MRFTLLLVAVAAGLAAAQNITTGPAEDVGQCLIACAEKTVQDNSAAANKCAGIKDSSEQTQCICKSDALVSELQTCLTNTCPNLVGDIDLKQNCADLNGAPYSKAAAMLPVLAASGALITGTFLF